ncbi:hypothetical protein DFR52_103238 [Hoeflea marina]|uniref:Uncharacterized protein n=1 Tax=Hoeflea marina TaxID=274592 RepID=A0A317PLW2_9HYPH|nr:hypothetical protein [Hoeflea marina]PWW00037.1 hypothetical protein DFR52_103238 [Hoeflea marina]
MAGDKKVKVKKAGSGGGVMGLVSKSLAILSALAGTALLAGLYDTMHLGLGELLHGFSIVPVSIFGLGAILAVVLSPKPAAVTAAAADEARLDALVEFQSKAASRFSALQNQIDSFSGQDQAALLEENRALKAELDAIHQAEREKVGGEMEALRLRNEELERQIREWASQAVGKAVRGEEVPAMKAA